MRLVDFQNLDDLLFDLELPVCFLLLGDVSSNSSSKTCVRWYWPSSRFMVVSTAYGSQWPPSASVISVLFTAHDFTLVPACCMIVLSAAVTDHESKEGPTASYRGNQNFILSLKFYQMCFDASSTPFPMIIFKSYTFQQGL